MAACCHQNGTKTELAVDTPLQRQEREYDSGRNIWIVRTLNEDGTIARREETGSPPKTGRRKLKPKGSRPSPRDLTDPHVEALREFHNSEGNQKATYYPDSKLPGLFIYIGPRKAT